MPLRFARAYCTANFATAKSRTPKPNRLNTGTLITSSGDAQMSCEGPRFDQYRQFLSFHDLCRLDRSKLAYARSAPVSGAMWVIMHDGVSFVDAIIRACPTPRRRLLTTEHHVCSCHRRNCIATS